MIKFVSEDRCIKCNLCVRVCPTDVFDKVSDSIPIIARQEDCQTCFICELYCPVDALYVSPLLNNTHEPQEVSSQEKVLNDWINSELEALGKEQFLHKLYDEYLKKEFGPAINPDDIVVEGGKL